MDRRLHDAHNAALETLGNVLDEHGLTLDKAFLTFSVEGEKIGTGGHGFDGTTDVLAFLLAQATQLAHATGMDLRIVYGVPPIGEG